jgi:hypothetical protein
VVERSGPRGQQHRLSRQVVVGDFLVMLPEQGEHVAARHGCRIRGSHDVLGGIVHPVEPHVGEHVERGTLAVANRVGIDVCGRTARSWHAAHRRTNLDEFQIIPHVPAESLPRPDRPIGSIRSVKSAPC